MKRIMLLVALLSFCLCGCATLASLFGVHQDPVTGDFVADPTGGIVGHVVSLFVPWAGLAAGAVSTTLAALRGRQWKQAAISTFNGVEDLKNAGVLSADHMNKFKVAHEVAGIYGFVEKVVGKLFPSKSA